MLEDLGQLLSSIWTFLGIVIWIIVMIDCLYNNSVKNKVGWILFIVFGNWVGVVVYILARRGALLKRIFQTLLKWVRQSSSTHYYSPSSPPPPPQPSMPYYNYQQGYQAYQPPYQAASPPSATITQSSDFPAYEQPQATYPEMPPMEQ